MAAAPTPREMEERMARAIARSLGSFQFPDDPERNWQDCLPEARAALAVVREALAEPTREMCDVGWATERGEAPMTPRDVWLTMLAASPLRAAP